MAKRVAHSVGNINDFPDDVLCQILSFLPFKEAVRTSILSTRWRYLFSFLSSLDLVIPFWKWEELQLFMDLDCIDRLVCFRDHQLPSIVRFRLQTDEMIGFQRLCVWISALVSQKIQELDLCIDCYCEDFNDIPFPPNLFCCESLAVLKLNLCWDTSRFEFPLHMCLPHLKVLHLEEIRFPKNGSEERLFSSCPVLEDLVLAGYFHYDCTELKVSNQNLKTLTLKKIISDRQVVRILINAPSLVSLDYTISLDHTIVLEDDKSLAEAIIYSPAFIMPDQYIPAAPGALREIRNVQTLKLDYQILGDLKSYGLPIPLFEKMTCLKLQDWQFLFDPICLEYFLARCVVLETLVLEDCSPHSIISDTSNLYSMQKSQLAHLLCHLKTIEIQLNDIAQAKTLMGVIAFFLENARVLEKLEIHAKRGLPEQQVEIMKEITSFPRGSTKCRVLF